MFIDFGERKERRGERRGDENQGEERNIDMLPPVNTLESTHNYFVVLVSSLTN